MKKKYLLLLLLSMIVLVPALAWKFLAINDTNHSASLKKSESPFLFFVVTGLGSDKESISSKALKDAYCSENIYVLKASRDIVHEYMLKKGIISTCRPVKLIESINEFSVLAKDNLLLLDIDQLSNAYKVLAVDSINYFENPSKYPLQSIETKFDPALTKFTMTGVTAITRAAGRVADKEGIDFLTKNLKPYFQNSDFVHISNEVSFMDSCEYVPGTTRFCTKELHFKALKDLNCSIVELTGNHNRDFGDKAFKKTYQWYKDNNIKTFGGGFSPEDANTPLVITLKDGKKLGLIGFNEACPLGECAKKPGEVGANFYEREKAKKVIDYMRTSLKVDYIIASVQYTEWDKYEPHASQQKIGHDLVDFGADFVYGSQAHQIQQVEIYKGKTIYHGLGNFLFDQIHRTAVRQAFFLNHYFYKGKLIQTIPVFTFMKENRQQSIATAEQRKEMKKAVYVDSMLYKKY